MSICTRDPTRFEKVRPLLRNKSFKTKIDHLVGKFGRNAFLFVSGSTLLAVVASNLPASFRHTSGYFEVTVDGQNFGELKDPSIQKQLFESISQKKFSVDLERGFITDPSLYEWAKTSVHNKIAANNLTLKHFSDSAQLLGTYTLKQAKPVSWNISKDEEKLTGYRESVQVSFSSISVE